MTTDAVVVDDVHVAFGKVNALDGVDLRVPAGTTLAVLGHNGAGKTTLIRVLTTRIRPDHGHVLVDGIDAIADPVAVRGANRRDRSVRRPRRLPHHDREPGAGRPARRAPFCRSGPSLGPRRAFRPARPCRPPRRGAVGRIAATRRPRRQPGGLTGGAVPRRAHHRPRPDRAPGPMGRRRRADRGRYDRRPHHPIPGRSRPAGPAGRGSRPRPRRRYEEPPPS